MSPAKAKPAKKMSSSKSKEGKKLRKKNKDGTLRKKSDHSKWGSYIYKVLKQAHGKIGISSKAMAILESLCDDLFEQLASGAAELTRGGHSHTLGAREFLHASSLVLGGQLGRLAANEGQKAFSKYLSASKGSSGAGKKKSSKSK